MLTNYFGFLGIFSFFRSIKLLNVFEPDKYLQSKVTIMTMVLGTAREKRIPGGYQDSRCPTENTYPEQKIPKILNFYVQSILQ